MKYGLGLNLSFLGENLLSMNWRGNICRIFSLFVILAIKTLPRCPYRWEHHNHAGIASFPE